MKYKNALNIKFYTSIRLILILVLITRLKDQKIKNRY